MRKLHHFTVAAACSLIASISIVHASEGNVSAQACAARDLKVVTLIEQRGEAHSLPAEELADAFFKTMDARRACNDGRFEEALAIYSRVIARLNAAAP
ncbi:hypothetical protein [Phreatobacter sp. AB_2022a]|uniref:hypothetical protein n=1 Tax=Phreatobacter sp. AB_2022a TaxID=3003134 RepID=UPI0022873864|nr:hypothetical protein [Phreatobacter sp. AB_2022a]MCZ0737748.1 hypothetical protein [Phreatobacter sp. AB_2022a]